MIFAPIDIFFLVLILVFAVTAAVRGLISELFSKAAFIGGIIAAILLTPVLDPYMKSVFRNETLSRTLSFLLIFIAVFLLIKIIQEIVRKIFSGDILRGLDHSLGFFFGVVEGIAVAALVLAVIEGQPWINTAELTQKSLFARMLDPLIRAPAQAIKGLAA
jgi:membrane protein required for colicin V production